MYQSETKESFIKTYMTVRVIGSTSLYSLFHKTSPFEYKLNKDCSDFTQDEILEMYKSFKSKSVNVVLNYNSILRAYCKWKQYYCTDLNTYVPYDDITIGMIKDVVPKNTSKMLTREDITDIEEQLFNWTDKAIIECLFEGISGDSMCDLVSITADIVDHNSMQIVFKNGKICDLTERLYQLLLKAFEETEYICYGKTLKVKQLYGYKQLYKERDNAHAPKSNDKYFRWVYRKIQNFRKHVGIPSLTMKNIASSGMCHYIKIGMHESDCDLKTFLLSENGSKLMDKYGYNSEFRVNNVMLYYKDLIE